MVGVGLRYMSLLFWGSQEDVGLLAYIYPRITTQSGSVHTDKRSTHNLSHSLAENARLSRERTANPDRVHVFADHSVGIQWLPSKISACRW